MNLYDYSPIDEFNHKDLISLQDYSADDIYHIISLALSLKKKQKNNISHPLLKGKTLGMIFAKASTRTRISFEVGIYQLGGYGLFLNSSDIQLGRGETIEDSARVLSRYVDGLMIRTFAHKDVKDLARYGSIPVINGLTDLLHPCQILADLMTIYEAKGRLKGLKISYVGDGNNVANSLLIGASKLGLHISIGSPKGYEIDKGIVSMAKSNAKISGSKICITDSPEKAVAEADIIYTDVWTSMGQEEETENRQKIFAPYQVNDKLFALANPDAIFLHCLPAYRGLEVTAGVIDGPNSMVFEEAENRLHVQKAIMVLLMGDRDKNIIL